MMRMTTKKKMVEKIILMLMVMIWSYESLQSQYGNMCLALFESLSVINALNHLVNNVLSRCTCLLTLLKIHMDVNNAIKHLLRQVLWSITSYTLYTNTGESRNKCTMCDLSATGAKILRVHLVAHSGKKPHKCDHCFKSFHQPSHLRTHIREKPIKCT